MNEKWLNDVKFALVGLRWFAEDLEGNIEYLGQLIQAFQRDPSSDREQRIRNEFDSYGLLAPRRNPKRRGVLGTPRWGCPPEINEADRCLHLHCSICRRCGYRVDQPHENHMGEPCRSDEGERDGEE